MAEMTIGEIIKIVVAVLVLVVVLFGVYVGFKTYIIPYFADIPVSASAGIAVLFLRKCLNIFEFN